MYKSIFIIFLLLKLLLCWPIVADAVLPYQLIGQRESSSATATVLAKQEAELNATAHQSVDAKMAREQQNQQVLLLLLQNKVSSNTETTSISCQCGCPYCCYEDGHSNSAYQLNISGRRISSPILVVTSPDAVQTLLDTHTLITAALFQRTETKDYLDIEAKRGAEINATADQKAAGIAGGANTVESTFRQVI
ncbi:hypothetical protein BDF19DRAFT_466761 [Syncephalis fuscata]|nr:hypothetical protein BDF19DRAFT_466761 [Syncephalis fuscata]